MKRLHEEFEQGSLGASLLGEGRAEVDAVRLCGLQERILAAAPLAIGDGGQGAQSAANAAGKGTGLSAKAGTGGALSFLGGGSAKHLLLGASLLVGAGAYVGTRGNAEEPSTQAATETQLVLPERAREDQRVLPPDHPLEDHPRPALSSREKETPSPRVAAPRPALATRPAKGAAAVPSEPKDESPASNEASAAETTSVASARDETTLSGSTLAMETSYVRRTRELLEADQLSAAADMINGYRLRFQEGLLREEMDYLNLHVLAARAPGSLSAAARRFAQDYPGSAYGEKIQVLLFEEPSP